MDDIWGLTGTSPAQQGLVRAQSQIGNGDFNEAIKTLAPFVATNPADGRGQLLYCRALFGLKNYAEAADAARAAVAVIPNMVRLRVILAQALLASGKTAEAQTALDEAARIFSDSAAIAALQAESRLKAGAFAQALEASERAVALEPASPTHAAMNIALRCMNGAEVPQTLLATAEPENAIELTRKLALLLRKRKAAEVQRALLARALKLFPDAAAIRLMHAENLLAEDKTSEALAILGDPRIAAETLEPGLAKRMFGVRAEAHRALRDFDAARADYERILALDPQNEDALQKLYLLHRRLGNDQEMRAYAKRIARAGSTRMPATLAEGLHSLATSNAKVDLGPDKVGWAWDLADKSVWQHDAWLEEIKWGRRADLLLRAWWLNLFERGGEIAALIDPPAPGLNDLLKPGERALAVTSHLGPMAGFVHFMQTCGRPFRGFGFSGPDPVVGDAPPMRIASNVANQAAALRELVDEIRKGTLVGFAPDSPTGKDTLKFEFLGRRVSLSPLVPRLAQRHGAASIYCQPLWHGERIRLEFQRLPDPAPGEAAEAHVQRWCRGYLAALEPVMRGDPRNLNLASGLWVNARNSADKREA